MDELPERPASQTALGAAAFRAAHQLLDPPRTSRKTA
jgi:hypothetical protein